MTLFQAVLSTLAYHDIFDYPLTEDEIHKYLIGKKSSPKSIAVILESPIPVILERSERILSSSRALYALRGRQKLFIIRKQRAKYSQVKFKRAQLYAKFLSAIPTVKLVAISGALAMQNSKKDDDIDLVIIAAKNTLWTTRFLANVILFPFKRQPSPPLTINTSPLTSNKACLNIFIDESNLKITPQNLYTAHEICQLKPLWDRNETYSRFIKANNWLKRYLPNWQPHSFVIPAPPTVIPAPPTVIPAEAGISNSRGAPKKALVVSRLVLSVEIFLKNFQLWYMRKKISTERIEKTQLFFHPSNTQDLVLREYQKRLKKFS